MFLFLDHILFVYKGMWAKLKSQLRSLARFSAVSPGAIRQCHTLFGRFSSENVPVCWSVTPLSLWLEGGGAWPVTADEVSVPAASDSCHMSIDMEEQRPWGNCQPPLGTSSFLTVRRFSGDVQGEAGRAWMTCGLRVPGAGIRRV